MKISTKNDKDLADMTLPIYEYSISLTAETQDERILLTKIFNKLDFGDKLYPNVVSIEMASLPKKEKITQMIFPINTFKP